MKHLFGLIVLMFSFFGNVAGQEEKTPKLGIINGRATYLPIPAYPQEAKDFCVSGKVKIDVLVSEKGKVIVAKAVLGDELLRNVSVKAVKKARFGPTYNGIPVKYRGIIVYNFPAERKCVDAGIVNKKAKFIPKPEFPKGCRCAGKVEVQIIIDPSGKITNARAISGHPLLRAAALKSAKETIFYPSLITTEPIFFRASLVYDFSPSGKISF